MKTAIILGITGSIGRVVAQKALDGGYSLIGTSRSGKDSGLFNGKQVKILPLDMGSKESIDTFCKSIEEVDRIDIFTNTIGCYTMNRFENIPIEEFESDVKVNFTNYAYLLQKLAPKFQKDSSIVFVLTEMVIDEPSYFLSSYVSSKYALLGLMKTLAGEWKGKGVRVNAISPGMMETNFSEKVPSIIKEQYILNSQKGRLIEPKEVGEALWKLAMDESKNGVNLALLGKKAR